MRRWNLPMYYATRAVAGVFPSPGALELAVDQPEIAGILLS
jgi:hypothetical protein